MSSWNKLLTRFPRKQQAKYRPLITANSIHGVDFEGLPDSQALFNVEVEEVYRSDVSDQLCLLAGHNQQLMVAVYAAQDLKVKARK
jgi:hypothetical protein